MLPVHSQEFLPDNKEKIALAISMFDKYVDVKSLEKKIISFRTTTITPRMFQYQIVKRAKENKKHIVLPEGDDDRILMAADALIKQNVVDLTILGNKESIVFSDETIEFIHGSGKSKNC